MNRVFGSFSMVVVFLLSSEFARAQEPGPTIRQTVQEVVLDVVVRDARGRGVKNLKPTHLEVYEDGAREDIRTFKLVLGLEGLPQGNAANAAARRLAAPANPLKAVNLICIVFSNL